MADMYSLKSHSFRYHIIQKMENVVLQGKKNIPRKIIEEMEFNIFERASDREEYLDLTAKLLLTLKDLKLNEGDSWDFNSLSMEKPPSLLQLHIPVPDQSNSSLVRGDEDIWADFKARHSSYDRAPERPMYEDRQDYLSNNSRIQSDRGRTPDDRQGRQQYYSRDDFHLASQFSGHSRAPEETTHSHDRDRQNYFRDNGVIARSSNETPHWSLNESNEREYRSNDRNNQIASEPLYSSRTGFERNGREERDYADNRGEYRKSNERDVQGSTFQGRRSEDRRHSRKDMSPVEAARNANYSPPPHNQRTLSFQTPYSVESRSPQRTTHFDFIQRKRKLSGAARKKLKYLVNERGISHEDALNFLEEERRKREKQFAKTTFQSTRNPPQKNASPVYTKVKTPLSEKKPATVTSSRKVEPSQKPPGFDKNTPTRPNQKRSLSPIRPNQKRSLPPTRPNQKRSLSPNTGSRKGEPPQKKIEPSKENPIASSKNQSAKNNGSLDIGIVDAHYPETILDSEHLHTLQRAIMKAIEDIPDNGPQVRFKNCTYNNGMLLLKCADKDSCNWILKNVEKLRPWDGVQLKTITGKEGLKLHIYTALIPDDVKGTKLSEETVLTRLKKMNHGLLTEKWKVLKCEEGRRKTGHVYTFSIDKDSLEIMRNKLDLKPYFGFGQVEFWLKK